MKNLFVLFALAASMLVQAQKAVQLTSGPVLTLDKGVHDFGTIEFKSDGTCNFAVTNTGNEPLIISDCKKSCGCTTPKCPNNPIMPGETSIITLKYDTSRVGPFDKSVTVSSNATNEPVKIIRIKGNVKPDPQAAQDNAPQKAPTGAPNGN